MTAGEGEDDQGRDRATGLKETATTRERIRSHLREQPLSPETLAGAVDVPTTAVLEHVRHVARSLEGENGAERLLVAPPECRDCGFDGFDDLVNRPSRCPACESEAIDDPLFIISDE